MHVYSSFRSVFRSSTTPRTSPVSTTPVLSPFSLLARQPTSLTIVSGTVSILLTHGLMESYQSPPHTISRGLVPDITPSNPRTFSSTSVVMEPPRASTPSLRMLPRSSSLVTSPPPGSTTSGLRLSAARRQGNRSSIPPFITPKPLPTGPTPTFRASRVARSGTPPGLAPIPPLARTPSRTASGRSAATCSRTSSMTAPAPLLAPTPTSVRVSFDQWIVPQLLIDLLIRSRPVRKGLPVWCLLARPH